MAEHADRDAKAATRAAPTQLPKAPSNEAAPGVFSSASLLDLQRAGGNAAVVRMLEGGGASSEPPIQRVWGPSSQSHELWSAVIAGVRWMRHNGSTATVTYSYDVEDASQVPADYALLHEQKWEDHDAAFWRAHAPLIWRDELAAPTPTAAPTPAAAATAMPTATAAPQKVAGPVKAAATKAVEPAKAAATKKATPEKVGGAAKAAAAVKATRQPHDPVLTTFGAPEWAPGGAFVWKVSMAVAPVVSESWIIQKVSLTEADGDTHVFWEAFPVAGNAARATNEDTYQWKEDEPVDVGTITVVGRMQHFVFSAAAPPAMTKGGGIFSDDKQWSTNDKPPYWTAEDGTPHNLTFRWNGTALVQWTPVPASALPARKASSADLNTG